MAFNPFGGKTYTLQSSISSSATSIPLTSFIEPVSGVPYTMVLLNTDIAYGTIQPKTTSSEFISFTGITQNNDGTATLTGVTRGLAKKYPFTSSVTFQLPHSGQSQFIISDAPQLFKKYGALDNDEIITGQWEAPDPQTAQGLVTRDYMLALINGGAISVNRIVVAGKAGETVAAGNLLYLKLADGFWWKADADLIATLDNVQLAISQGAGTAGNNISGGVLQSGLDTNNTGTAGAYGYASNTAGAIGSSAGTNSFIVGQYVPALGGFYFNPAIYQLPTIAEGLALGGSQGVVGSSNKFITQDNTLGDGVDQEQTTQNASSTVGEADTSGLRNILAQSFIPTITKIRGFKLYKSADTGTFTGTVTVSVQADTTGSPSGTPLGTVTFTNAQWLALSTGEFECIFSTEYASMVAGSLYWIVIQTSTSDTSNHPNIGTNSAGGYASGSAKFKNTVDGWVAIATIDLYFKTLEGVIGQLPIRYGAPIQVFDASGTWTWYKPTNARVVEVISIGAGGGGASGRRNIAGGTCTGGGGGGGGAVSRVILQAANLGSTESVIVGAGGAGGAAKSSDGDGNDGGNGGISSFGTWVNAGGGGGGKGGTATTAMGGAGGGTASSAVTTTPGGPGAASDTGATGGQGAKVNTDISGICSEWGGASGGPGSAKAGGSSVFAGPGGGGGGISSGTTGGAGGTGASYTAGGGGAGGATEAANGTAGSTNATSQKGYCGSGGGGGSGTDATGNAGSGATGGLPGGGGGGGGGKDTGTGNSGAGGTGGVGRVIVIVYA